MSIPRNPCDPCLHPADSCSNCIVQLRREKLENEAREEELREEESEESDE
jgi:hypothetical protein